MSPSTILALTLDEPSQARLDALRQAHYPAALNQIAAHLTLFHQLPATEEVRDVLVAESAALEPFGLRLAGLKSLGRGVACTVESRELVALHARLAQAFQEHLSPQDRQGFRPHVVLQNKATAEQAKTLFAKLSADYKPWDAQAIGLSWWDYLGGPWQLREHLPFSSVGAGRDGNTLSSPPPLLTAPG